MEDVGRCRPCHGVCCTDRWQLICPVEVGTGSVGTERGNGKGRSGKVIEQGVWGVVSVMVSFAGVRGCSRRSAGLANRLAAAMCEHV